ncbi:MAG: hypothetical protein IJF08_10245 [Clostridia bacterium]|nr:hypothetical protein [Clostridia bacterium]
MDKDQNSPRRKSTRLKGYDYSTPGAYFVTICTRDRMRLLSEIVKTDLTETCQVNNHAVGEGLAPPLPSAIGREIAEETVSAEYLVKLEPCGKVVQAQLQAIETRFPSVRVQDFVIMPDHIHAVIVLCGRGGASPSPTLDDVICAFKSLTSRICKQKYGIEKIFQRSSAEHIIRDREDYETRRKYIYENPMRWYYKYKS